MHSHVHRPRRRQRQQGAVLVEGLIASSALLVLLGCMLVVRSYSSLQLLRLDEARQEAWHKAMQGCEEGEPSLLDLARQLIQGELPFLDGLVPSLREAERTFAVKGLFEAQGKRSIKFICNPRPGKKKPLTDMAGWVMELFF